MTIHCLSERNGSVGEPDVHIFAIDLSFANFEDALRIEADTTQSAVQR